MHDNSDVTGHVMAVNESSHYQSLGYRYPDDQRQLSEGQPCMQPFFYPMPYGRNGPYSKRPQACQSRCEDNDPPSQPHSKVRKVTTNSDSQGSHDATPKASTNEAQYNHPSTPQAQPAAKPADAQYDASKTTSMDSMWQYYNGADRSKTPYSYPPHYPYYAWGKGNPMQAYMGDSCSYYPKDMPSTGKGSMMYYPSHYYMDRVPGYGGAWNYRNVYDNYLAGQASRNYSAYGAHLTTKGSESRKSKSQDSGQALHYATTSSSGMASQSSVEERISHPPSSFSEAVCMYIDHLIAENAELTSIRDLVIDEDFPVNFEQEMYYQNIMAYGVDFPTTKFRKWLQKYNVDVEIAEPESNPQRPSSARNTADPLTDQTKKDEQFLGMVDPTLPDNILADDLNAFTDKDEQKEAAKTIQEESRARSSRDRSVSRVKTSSKVVDTTRIGDPLLNSVVTDRVDESMYTNDPTFNGTFPTSFNVDMNLTQGNCNNYQSCDYGVRSMNSSGNYYPQNSNTFRPSPQGAFQPFTREARCQGTPEASVQDINEDGKDYFIQSSLDMANGL